VNCVEGIEADESRIRKLLESTLMVATALNPHIGYDNAARIVKKALAEDIGVREAAIASGLVTDEQYDAWVKPEDMLGR
jgi:fumarate hydratase class II